MRSLRRGSGVRLWLGSGLLLAVGGCLSDAQISQILQTAILTGLSQIVQQLVVGLLGGAQGA